MMQNCTIRVIHYIKLYFRVHHFIAVATDAVAAKVVTGHSTMETKEDLLHLFICTYK